MEKSSQNCTIQLLSKCGLIQVLSWMYNEKMETLWPQTMLFARWANSLISLVSFISPPSVDGQMATYPSIEKTGYVQCKSWGFPTTQGFGEKRKSHPTSQLYSLISALTPYRMGLTLYGKVYVTGHGNSHSYFRSCSSMYYFHSCLRGMCINRLSNGND